MLKYNIERNRCEETGHIDLLERHVIVDRELLSFSSTDQSLIVARFTDISKAERIERIKT